MVADFENISLEASFNLPITQALNDLSFLKAKNEYEILATKQITSR